MAVPGRGRPDPAIGRAPSGRRFPSGLAPSGFRKLRAAPDDRQPTGARDTPEEVPCRPRRIKNWRTRTADQVKRLRTRFAFVLTGPPLENRLEDLYSLMQVVDGRVLGPLWQFHRDFHVVDPDGRIAGYRNLGELRRRLAAVMLRRDRSLMRDQLPDRIQQQIDVPMTSAQRHVHDDAVDSPRRLAAIRSRRPLSPVEKNLLMAALARARMTCDALGLVDKETVGSPKLDELRRLLEELAVEGGHKVVIFSGWERMTAMAADAAVWVFAEALPAGAITPGDAAVIAQALALNAAPAVPHELCASSLRALREVAEG